MWLPHSYRFWQWISPDLLPGKPCKVQSWVWSAELAVTLWVSSPRWGLGTHYRHSPTTAPSRKRSFFLCNSKLYSLTALRAVSPEKKLVNMKNLINPGRPKPWEQVSGSPHPLHSWRAAFSWWFLCFVLFCFGVRYFPEAGKHTVIPLLPSQPLRGLISSPLLAVWENQLRALPSSLASSCEQFYLPIILYDEWVWQDNRSYILSPAYNGKSRMILA